LTITAQGTGYSGHKWYLDGVDTDQSGNTYIFSSGAAGKHTVGLFVEKDGRLYNTNIIITVVVPYTITFDANGGSGTVPTQTILPGSNVTLPSGDVLSRTGYTFGGWNTNNSGTGTNYNVGSFYTPTGNVTLYARWINYTVIFDVNGGSGTVLAMIVLPGSSIILPDGSGLTRSGYTFNGWNTNNSGTGTNHNAGTSYTPNGNVTLYARWSTPRTVTFNINGGSGTVPAAQTVLSGSIITLPSGNGFTKTGCTFVGWVEAFSFDDTFYNAGGSFTVSNSITLYAKWLDNSETTPLTTGTWANGSITSTSAVWYSFNVTSGTTYYIWWNDGFNGNGTKTLDVKVSAYYSNGISIFTGVDSAWSSPYSFTASSSGRVSIKVEPYNSDSTGTFAIAYRTTSIRP